MPTPALLLLIATLLPLASFTLLMFVGKRMGTPLAGWMGTGAIFLSFVCSILATFSWLSQPEVATFGFSAQLPIQLTYHWIPVANEGGKPHFLDVGIYVDSLTIAMFGMITFIATLVHLFSVGYMSEDKRYPRFFTYLGLFCFSMLGLVIGGTTLHLFVFWELVGLCSYLLIGFWYEKKSASNAAIKAFVVNRIGDFGFLIGFGILFYHLGNVTLPDMWSALGAAGAGKDVILSGGGVFTAGLLTVMGIGLFFGAVGKSAQFPLHVWLPDAMEGPTPVSALIHAATMVAAGVYLVGRIFPILTPDAKLFIAIIGCTTLTMAALIAIAQSDIKKVLAYSTLSQLGYMILAMGIGSWVGALFHLITHAFFKALLFLGSGSVIHAAHHEQELPQYGGLIRKIPVTGVTFLIAVFAIAGFGVAGWGFSGFYSKDLILANAASFGFLAEHEGRSKYLWILFYLPVAIAYVTPFYMMRCWTLTFWGKPRNQHLYDHAHESPIMWVPLVALAVASIVGGKYLGVREMIEAAQTETSKLVKLDAFQFAWPGEKATPEVEGAEDAVVTAPPAGEHVSAIAEIMEHGEHTMHSAIGFAWLIGMGAGFLVYMNGYGVANALMKVPPVRWIHTWLYRKMYFDEFYYAVFLGITMALARLSAWFDKYIVDGLVNLAGWLVKQSAVLSGLTDKYVVDGAVNGAGKAAYGVGAAVRAPQSGRIRMYVTVLMIAVAIGLAVAILVVLSN